LIKVVHVAVEPLLLSSKAILPANPARFRVKWARFLNSDQMSYKARYY